MLLRLELPTSVLATRLFFLLLSRLVFGVAALITGLFVSVVVAVVLLAAWLLVSVWYYVTVYRLWLALFALAARAEAEG